MQSSTLNSMMGTSWHSYCKIWNVGSVELNTFFDEPVQVEEKVDGSQFSFGVFNGEIKARSKSKEIIVDNPEKLFSKAIETIKDLVPLLRDGWTYRGEFLGKTKHNALAYSRVPSGNIIIFDINDGEESYLPYAEKKTEAERLGLEVVPLLYTGLISSPEQFMKLLDNVSVLGGQKIEGVVCKNYTKFGRDKKVLMAKFVSESFKEVHKSEWKVANPGNADILQIIQTKYASQARWNKAIIHLKERGELDNSPKDIGNLIKEVQEDIKTECKEEIKEELWQWAKDKILRGATKGIPTWYKEELVKSQFDDKEARQEVLDQLTAESQELGLYNEVLVTANPEE
jgi:hypothetical protein